MSKIIFKDNYIELEATDELQESEVFDKDLAPILKIERSFGTWDEIGICFFLGISIPNLTLGSLLTGFFRLSYLESIAVLLTASVIFSLFAWALAYPGMKFGIPSSVLFRSAFGIFGSRLPSLFRWLTHCAWFGLQCFLGGRALAYLILKFIPSWNVHFGKLQLLGFVLLWLSTLYCSSLGNRFIYLIKRSLIPLALISMAGFYNWSSSKEEWSFRTEAINSLGDMLSALLVVLGVWSIMALNLSDYSRFSLKTKTSPIGAYVYLPVIVFLISLLGLIKNPFAEISAYPVIGLVLMMISLFLMGVLNSHVVMRNDYKNLVTGLKGRWWMIVSGLVSLGLLSWELISQSGFIRADFRSELLLLSWLTNSSSYFGLISAIVIMDFYFAKNAKIHLLDVYRFDAYYPKFHGPGLYAIIISALLSSELLGLGNWGHKFLWAPLIYFIFDSFSWRKLVIKDFILE